MSMAIRRLHEIVSATLKLAAPAIVALGLVAAATGGASAVTCGTSEVMFDASSSDVTVSCGGFHDGNGLNGTGGDEPASPTLAGVNLGGAMSGFLADGALILTGMGTNTGTWTINVPLGSALTSLVIALQGTVAQSNPDWAWFNLTAGALTGTITGTWSITDNRADKTLQEAYLYGTIAAVPIPAGVALGATALGMLGLVGWRRRKAAA